MRGLRVTDYQGDVNQRLMMVEERMRRKREEMDKLAARQEDMVEKQTDIREMVRDMIGSVTEEIRKIRVDNDLALRDLRAEHEMGMRTLREENREELEAMAKLLQAEAAKIADKRMDEREVAKARERPNLFTQDRILMGIALLLFLFLINPDLAGLALKIFM